ncbi:hypothetical protein EON64_14925 [archaeon]|nr:MAG: hypothetical protein EON64_14925 [archaeon]
MNTSVLSAVYDSVGAAQSLSYDTLTLDTLLSLQQNNSMQRRNNWQVLLKLLLIDMDESHSFKAHAQKHVVSFLDK